MKPTVRLRSFLAIASSSLLAITSAHAATYYWDGTSSTVNGLSSSTTGTTWSTSAGNWDNGTAEVFWTTANSAVFGGTASTVTIGTGGVSIGSGSQFMRFDVTGYILDAGANGLNFGTSATDNITLFANHTGAAATTTITNTVGGSGNVILSAQNGGVANANTFLFNGTSAGGWSGTTTVNAGVTLSVAASSQALLNTTGGITLNGGNILLTNTATGSENTINRINDTAAIASYGSGSISIANTSTASRQYSETIGSITHNNGQLSLGFATNQNQTANTQTLNIGGLTVNGGTATIAVNSGGSGAGPIGVNSNIRISGIANSTPTGEIIGPWMTGGSILAAQSDWAVYTSDVVGGYRRIASAAIGSSAQTTWTSSTATGNYTAANGNPLTSTVNNRLTANRFVNTLRATFAETNASSGVNWNINTATDTITFGSHALTNGDVVVFRTAPTGLTDTRPYYVINSVAGTSFQLSLTPGGGVLDLTNVQAATSFMATGLNLDGNTLGMNGYITGTTGSAAIGGGNASTITLPTTTSGNLYLHGANNIWIDPSITDNGAGVLTLVKSGTTTVTLSGNNTYAGGTVINAGTLTFNTTAAAQSGSSRNITFGGSGTLTTPDTSSFGTLTVNQGAVAALSGNNITFATTTGSGTVATASAQSKTLNLGDASTFTGNIVLAYAFNNLSLGTPSIQFTKLNDAAGSSIQIFRNGGGTDGGQVGQIALTGDVAPLTFDNRQIQLLPRTTSNQSLTNHILYNNNATAANKWVINTSLLNLLDRNSTSFTLAGSNAGDNAFNGTIGDSTIATGILLNFQKTGTGKWILSGNNTYTGSTTITGGGTLQISTLANGGSASSIGASSNAAGSLILNGGTLRYTGGTISTDRLFSLQTSSTIDSSGTGAINFNNTGAMGFNTGATAKTLTLTGTNTGNNTIAAAIGNLTLATSIAKTGIGTWVLSGTNSATGTNSLSGGGTLVLDYTTNNNTKLASGALTVTGGGNLILRAGSLFVQTVASTSLAAGGGNLSITQDSSGTNTINLNAIARANGTSLSLAVNSVATTDTLNNTAGILGGWATVGSNWAKNSTNAVDGAIVGLTAGEYTTMPSSGGTGTVNYQLTGAASLSGTVTGNSLRISNDGDDQVLDIGNNRNLSLSAPGATGGLLYAGGNNNNYRITGTGTSRLGAQNSNQEVVINTYTGTLTVEVPVLSAGAISNGVLTKTGIGTLVLTAASDYTTTTSVNQGTLRANNTTGSATGTGTVTVFRGAALGGTGTIGGSTTIAAGGGLTFDLTTASGSHDKLDLAAAKTLTFSGTSTLTITSSGGTPGTGTYTLLTAPGGITGSVPAVSLPGGWTGSASISGNDLQLTVTSVGGGNTYADWIGTFPGAAGAPGFNQDADNDGVLNGAENFFGTNPSLSSGGLVAGAVTGSTFTFTHPQNATPASDVSAAYLWSKDLATFNANAATEGGSTVTLTTQLNTPVAGTTTVTATVTGTALPKLFVRVNVTQN